MAGQRQPTNLLLMKGKKHFSREELERRREREVQAPTDRVAPPDYLSVSQKQVFIDIACDLLQIGILSNLDCDALARYIQSEDNYRKYDALVCRVLRQSKTLEKAAGNILLLEKLENLRDKAFKQCRSAAADLGLTISSRCKLAVPKTEKKTDPNADMFGDAGRDSG